MTKYGSNLKKGTWLMAAVLATFITACSQDSIFGSPQGSGSSVNAGPAGTGPNLGAAAGFGGLGGGAAGMTNAGTLTVITGAQGQPVSIGTTGASTLVTGFHSNSVPYAPPNGCIYTEVLGANIGAVSGPINTAPPAPNPPSCVVEGTATTFAAAQAAQLAAQQAFNDLSPASRPGATDPGQNLGGLTLAPGIYAHSAGSFLITGSDLTLDAGGNANAVWVFQMASTLTVGAAGAPRSVILAGGAQPKNVFWQVGSAATVNASGGGTMVGTIISSAAISFGTNNATPLNTLNGRALALNASVTLNNTVINVPAP
jgi:hypothetical protein